VSESYSYVGYVWAYYFKHVLYIKFMVDPFIIAVIKDDSGAMVQRSYIKIFCVLNALNIVPSEKAYKLFLCLPGGAMILHQLPKNWPIRCGIIWLYHIYEKKCWLLSVAPQKTCVTEDISIYPSTCIDIAYPTILCLSSWCFPATNSIIGKLRTYLYTFSLL